MGTPNTGPFIETGDAVESETPVPAPTPETPEEATARAERERAKALTTFPGYSEG